MSCQLTHILEVDAACGALTVLELFSRGVLLLVLLDEAAVIGHVIAEVVGQRGSVGEGLLTPQMIALKHFQLGAA